MYIVKAKDGRIGFLTSYAINRIIVPKDDITEDMCYKYNKNRSRKKYSFSRDIIKAYNFSLNAINKYPEVAKVLFKELEEEWSHNDCWDGNLIPDKKKIAKKEEKELRREIKYNKDEIKELNKKISKLKENPNA